MALIVRILKKLGLLFLALIAIYAIGRPTHIWVDSFYTGVREPYLQMMAPDAVTIRWQSQEKFIGQVRYGMQLDQLKSIKTEKEENEEHEVRLTGLKPATKYFYSAGDEVKAHFKGKDFWFKTAPAAKTIDSSPVRFWVTGDQGYPNVVQNQVRDAALAWARQHARGSAKKPLFDFWITTGDNAYKSGSNKQFQAGFFEPYKSILRNTPVWPAYGNHDSRRWVFFDIFTFPTNAESGGVPSGTEHYYSFDYANIHFVMLDTQDADHDTEGKMLSWLKKDLKESRQQWLVAFFHHPPYTKGSHDSDNKRDSGGRLITVRKNILPVLEQAGVDLVVSGHSHMYERSELINCHYGLSDSFNSDYIREVSKQSVYHKKENDLSAYSGTIYNVIGSSSKVDEGPLNHPAMPYSLKEAGSMVIDVKANKLKAFFINKEGKVKDRFEIIKGVSNGVKTQMCTP